MTTKLDKFEANRIRITKNACVRAVKALEKAFDAHERAVQSVDRYASPKVEAIFDEVALPAWNKAIGKLLTRGYKIPKGWKGARQ